MVIRSIDATTMSQQKQLQRQNLLFHVRTTYKLKYILHIHIFLSSVLPKSRVEGYWEGGAWMEPDTTSKLLVLPISTSKKNQEYWDKYPLGICWGEHCSFPPTLCTSLALYWCPSLSPPPLPLSFLHPLSFLRLSPTPLSPVPAPQALPLSLFSSHSPSLTNKYIQIFIILTVHFWCPFWQARCRGVEQL